jgi:hypothetical protein
VATVLKQLLGSQTSLLTTGLNSLANNSAAQSSTFDNTVAAAGDGYLLCDVELVVTYGVAPTANTGCSLWFLQTQDGTNFEDGSSSITPARLPDLVFPLRAVTTAQRIIRRSWLPQGAFQALLKNDGAGQAMAATGNTLKIRPVTIEGV